MTSTVICILGFGRYSPLYSLVAANLCLFPLSTCSRRYLKPAVMEASRSAGGAGAFDCFEDEGPKYSIVAGGGIAAPLT